MYSYLTINFITMKQILFLFSAILFISCQAETERIENPQKEVNEVVDIRIYSNGDIRFNGLMISDSSLPSHIQNLNAGKNTRARVIIDEKAPAGLIHKTQQFLHKQQVAKIKFETLSSEKFNSYLKYIIHVDVLSSGEILFEGKQLHPEDLKASLKNVEVQSSTKFMVSVSENARVGPVFDTLEELAAKDMSKIIYEDLTKYYRL